MLKIGFVDEYLDNWHCNEFPRFLREAIGKYHFDAEVTHAFANREYAPNGTVSTAEWCKERNMQAVGSVEELIDSVDAICLIAADDSRFHEPLSQKVLECGKPVFVDKTFAYTYEAGKRMFERADRSGTPVFSSSVQRYIRPLMDYLAEHPKRPQFVSTTGPHSIDRYAVHQLEVIIALMGTGVKRLKAFSTGSMVTELILDYSDKRYASFMQTPQPWAEFFFMVSEDGENGVRLASDDHDCYVNLARKMLQFFIDGVPPVPHEETLEILKIIDFARIARNNPDTWYTLE